MDHEIVRRVFKYIDAMPGAGKTEYFVNQAVALLGKNREAKTNLIYVAPTVRLLTEALSRVERHGLFTKEMRKRIVMVASPDKIEQLTGRCRVYKERPVQVVASLLGLNDNQDIPSVTVGFVLMTTHETFVQVPCTDKSGGDFEILRRSDVIFDEARQCVMESRTARDLSYYDLAVMSDRLFTLDPQPTTDSTWRVYGVSNAPTKAQTLSSFHTKRVRNVSPTIHKLREEVRKFSDNGRAGVYLMTTYDLADEKKISKVIRQVEEALLDPRKDLPEESLIRTVVTTLLRPTTLFNHYRSVVLTSAFFLDSQMYHFLLKDGHKFRNMMKENPEAIESIIKRDKRLRNNLPRRLLVAPLMKERGDRPKEQKFRYRSTLTAALLEQGMIVPVKVANSINHQTIDRDLTAANLIDTLLLKKPVTEKENLQKVLSQFCVPPLWILINECARILRQVFSNPKEAECLLVFNVKSRTWHGVPATAVVRELYARGSLRLAKGSKRDGAIDKEALARKCPKEWEERLAKSLYLESSSSLFNLAPSTKLHGLNNYSGIHAFAHLAALNPDPVMITLYRSLLGKEYDIDLDHSIENLVQTLYRTSLRRVECKDRVLMIVPYLSQAEALREKIGCDDFEIINQPRLTPLTYKKPVDSEVAKKNGSKGGRRSAEVRSLGLNEEQKKRYRSLSAQVRSYQKQIRDAPADIRRKHWESRINLLTKEKAEMVEAAKRIKDFKN